MIITKLNLENFKAFKKLNLNGIELKPITVLCGPNNSGKSSIIQSILLVKQTIESNKKTSGLLFSRGDLIKLDSFENVIYGHKIENKLSFSFVFGSDNYSYSLKYILEHVKENKGEIIEREGVINEMVYTESSENEKTLTIKLTKENEESYRLRYENIQIDGEARSNYADKVTKKVIPPKAEDISPDPTKKIPEPKVVEVKKLGGELIPIDFNSLIPSIRKEWQVKEDPKKKLKIEFENKFIRIGDILNQVFRDISYIGPLRNEPIRKSFYDGNVQEIGSKGENVLSILKRYRTNELDKAINNWMNRMNANEFRLEEREDVLSTILKSTSGADVTLADVGFGIGQILPIITEGLRTEKSDNWTIILEQPEIHLHPDSQLELADFFIEMVKGNNKRFIIETHSDHIINRLVHRIVKDETLKGLIAVYFVEKSTDTGSFIKPIEIDPNKGITNWPKGFFDQAADEKGRIIEALLKKQNRK